MKISVTDLEQFRLCCTTDWSSIDELAAKLSGQKIPPTPQMIVGSAWHEVLRTGHCHKYYWNAASVYHEEFAGGLFEVSAVAELSDMDVSLSGRVDWIRGNEIVDFKCSFDGHAPDPSKYEKSLQWRCYLWLTGADKLTYRVWAMDLPDEEGHVKIKGESSVTYYQYQGMEADIREWIVRFIEWRATL